MELKDLVQFFKDNYDKYIELIITMELGDDCEYFKSDLETRDKMRQNYMRTDDASMFDLDTLIEMFDTTNN